MLPNTVVIYTHLIHLTETVSALTFSMTLEFFLQMIMSVYCCFEEYIAVNSLVSIKKKERKVTRYAHLINLIHHDFKWLSSS